MEQRYKILGIDTDATHSKYGKVYIVHANPVIHSYGSFYNYSTLEDANTVYFFFKHDIRIYKQLDVIGRSGDVWFPVAEDFIAERSANRLGQIRTIYIHKSLYLSI